ncbi:MAG TPA: hypothetical protein VEI57_03035 [Nitrospirota bacterium]|nr:hypothetical protein [Nitrospirota bacterium]
MQPRVNFFTEQVITAVVEVFGIVDLRCRNRPPRRMVITNEREQDVI